MLKIENRNNFLTSSRAITLYLIDKIHLQFQTTLQYQLFTQSLKEIGKKMLKIESGNGQMDGRRDTPILNRGYNILKWHVKKGIK